MRAPILGILVSLSTLIASAEPTISIRIHPPSAIDSDLLLNWTATITNLTGSPIQDLPFHITVNAATFVARPAGCSDDFDTTTNCTIDLPADGSKAIVFTTRTFQPFGHFDVVIGSTSAGEVRYDEAVIGREFFVTTTADSGVGTLRQAITDMNASCEDRVPCIASFRIDESPTEDGLYFINLHSPLPVIVAPDAFIDGGSQIRRTNNSLNRPLIVLSGPAAGAGSGLVFRNTFARVTDLSVRNFRGNGIDSRAARSMFIRNFLVLNEGRGVVIDGGSGYVTDNVLSSNGRSGGFFWTPSQISVLRNIVNHNGASGLFFHKPEVTKFIYSEAYDNVIGENRHAGIGLSRTATGDYARNSFRDNGARAIDIGLDGTTTATVPGYPGRGGIAGAPTITSARFANGITTITGRLAPHLGGSHSFQRVSIYAGPGDVQDLIGSIEVRSVDFVFEIARDLRGQGVRAAMVTNSIENFDEAMTATSEMGEPRHVE